MATITYKLAECDRCGRSEAIHRDAPSGSLPLQWMALRERRWECVDIAIHLCADCAALYRDWLSHSRPDTRRVDELTQEIAIRASRIEELEAEVERLRALFREWLDVYDKALAFDPAAITREAALRATLSERCA